ncbi:hypothetical protein ACO0K0_01560 [Undibacterium sp. SXout11W]|uniref:hypothetical protein n=1 Tax=Undibacterium sp. SXout11W TaxID=3413050 RepID=UPI003BEF9246
MSEQENQQSNQLDALDMIGLEASREEAELQAQQDEFLNPTQEPLQPPGEAWAMIPMTLGMFASKILPELEGVFTPDACAKWGDAMALVSQKHGWDAGETISKWAPECALVMATVPIALPTYQAIKMRKVAADAAKRKPPELQANDQPALAPADAPQVQVPEVYK